MKRHYRGQYDAVATYERLRKKGVLGNHSYLHVSQDSAEIGWAPLRHLQLLQDNKYVPDWREQVQHLAEWAAQKQSKAFGYVGFDAVKGNTGFLPEGSPSRFPLVEFIVPGEMLTFKGEFVEHRTEGGILDLGSSLTVKLGTDSAAENGKVLRTSNYSSDSSFRDGVQFAVDQIRAGKIEKLVLSRYEAFQVQYDPMALFSKLVASRSFVDAFFLQYGDVIAMVASPELLLSSTDRSLVANPIAGTRRRGSTIEEDEKLRAELKKNHKEIVEHVLSVTTMYDELEPFCVPGSLVVARLLDMSYQQRVQHLSSIIKGQLGEEHRALDALWALFPNVTVAGFPKPEAVNLIRELEAQSRCIYSGVIGWAKGASDCRFSLAIRGVFSYGGTTFVHAGAGIMAESLPQAELDETTHKLGAMKEWLRSSLI